MTTGTTITVLVEKPPTSCLLAEHGLAFWIKRADKHILFDTGQAWLWRTTPPSWASTCPLRTTWC
jgi:hypothetical protein